MPTLTHRLSPLIALTSLLGLTACVPEPDDDDVVVDDDDSVGDDDDATGPQPIILSGQLIARSRESGGILSADEYQARSGLLVVYLLQDPSNLSDVLWKATMEGPGTFDTLLDPNLGPLWLTVIADCDGNTIIEDNDIRRDYAFNPLNGGTGDLTDLTLEIDVPSDCRDGGGGGGGGDDDDDGTETTISGPITLLNIDPAPIAVAVANEALTELDGWRFYDAGAPDYSVSVDDGAGLAAVIAYHESDGNGLFEPADYTGEATSNPIQLGVGDVEGVELLIPSGEPLNFPQPEGNLTLGGSVTYADYTGGDILVFATANDTNGQLLAAQTLAAPGPFSLQVPMNFAGMILWAVADPDSNGQYNLGADASDLLGPFNTETSPVLGLELELEGVPPDVNSLGGTITVGPNAGPNDRVVVYLMDSPTLGAQPVGVLFFGNPAATVDYLFEGLASDTYTLVAFLDFGSDASGPSEPDEPFGSQTEIVLSGGTNITDQDFALAVP